MNEARLRAVVGTAVDGIIFIDANGAVTMFNPACERMFGYSAAEIVGQNIKLLMPAPYHAEHDGYLSNYRLTRERKIIGIGREVVGRRRCGDTFPIELSVGEAAFEGEAFYVGILRDISERRRAADQRERLIHELVASNEETAHFAHVASHDLREPLRMITAFCGLVSTDYGDRLDDRGREFLSIAISGAAQMQTLLDDLIAYNQTSLEAERNCWFDTGACLADVMRNLHEAIRECDAQISHGALPRAFGNPTRFMRVMQNLVGNALKYVEVGVRPCVQVTAVAETDCWRFDVRDNGIGIDACHVEQIFEPFKRLHDRSHYAGVGLGLAICRKIVDGFGGEIGVRSAPGEGSTFSFTINIPREEGAGDEAAAS